MPRLLEADAEFLTLNYDTLAPDKQAEAKDWLKRYKQQQADEGEPLFPSVVTRQVEQENNLRRMFEAPDKIDYDPGYTSADPMHDKMQHANMALLASRYQKEPAEVASRYDFLLNDYARQKLGASEDVDTAKFYALAQKEIAKEKQTETTALDGAKAALRGEDVITALQAWQAKNLDRIPDSTEFTKGFLKTIEKDGDFLPIADRLLPLLEAGASKKEGQVFDQTKAQELGNMIEQLAGMKKAQRKSVYRSIAARIEAAGYDQKGFWSQMLGELDKGLYRMEGTLGTQAGQAADVMSNFPAMLAEGMTGNRDFGMTPAETAQTDANLARRERIGNVQEEILQIVSGELDPVRPTTGWMNETLETGLIKGPGAVAPFMAASALLGPYGAGLVFTADFAEQNRRELVQIGLDADQARKVGAMAAPLQAAVESLSNMVSLGKFPAVQAALPRFTRPVGGASLVGRYVQNSLISGATEFTEEQVQDNVVVPVMQELLGALEKDVPDVDWSFYKTRAANASPELAATLLPMALVFGGVMTAADAKLSRTTTQNVTLLMGTGMDQAQAVDVASQPTQEQRIRRGAELWSQRKGTKASMEKAQKKLADQYRTLAADSAAAVKELEARGVLPRLLPMQGGEYRLTFNDGSTADFKTREEALGGIHVYIRDRMQRSTRALRETIDTLTKNLEQGREFALEISPEAMPADEAVKRGIISPQALQERAEQGAILDATTLIENSVLTGKALGDEEAPLMLFGMSKNEWYDKEGRAIGMQRIKDDILRTTMRLWDGASPLTLIEEKTEGDAKVILSTPGKRQWMLDHLRAYEDASGDKLFTSDDNEQINDKQLIEAWSHMAQSYFVAAKDKVKGRTLGRYLRDIEEAELTAAMQGRASWWQAVVNRAQKLGELKAAGKLNEDVVAELEKQLGIDSQVKHEQGAMQEAQNVANEVAQQASDWVDDSQFDNLPPSGDTFSMASASGAAQANEPSPGGLSEVMAHGNVVTRVKIADISYGELPGVGRPLRNGDAKPILLERTGKNNDRLALVDGYHRLDGMIEAGETEVDAIILGESDARALDNNSPREIDRVQDEMRDAVKRFRTQKSPTAEGTVSSESAIAGVNSNGAAVRQGDSPQSSSAVNPESSSAAGGTQETFSLRVTPAQDAEYMAAVEAGDMEKAQRMVDEAAKAAGYKSASVIHSTNAEFNSFGRVRMVSTTKGRSEVITPIKSTGIGLIYATQNSAYSALFGDKQLKLYHNISNPADLRSLGSSNVSDSAFDATLSTLGITHKSSSMGAAPVFERLNKGQHKKAMLEAGFDGFALRERSGNLEADAIAGFDSSQFKSADPVTRDESGNVIPLSQRFNPADDRITYSLRPGDFASRAIPADASKVVQMPDGARLVGPTTFSIRAFHGTPHKVDKFTTAKIGTGEGAQAYGWGLYFAESRDVGEGYRDKLAQWTLLTSDGKIYDDRKELKNLNVRAVLNKNGSIDEAVARARSVIESIPGTQGAELALADIATLEKLKQSGGLTKTKGNLYTVELLPDEDQFLDWDKPLSGQSEKVKAAIASAEWDGPKDRYENGKFIGDVENALAYSKRRGEAMNGADLYAVIVSALRPKAGAGIAEMQKASQKLASLGIPGIRYLDQGSRGAGDGTRNFVIFDENLVRILEENGKPVAQDTFSLRPGDFASRVEAMFSPFQRSPEARLVMARVAKDRALRLGNELIEKASVIRTMGSIDREARVRAALAEDKAVQDYLEGLTPAARQTLEWQPADLQDDPLVAAMLDFGKLMSKTTALQRGKLDLKMGDFDGAPWLPPSFYSKGAGIMPDQMAQAMFDAGLLPDAYTDTLWSELSKRIEATRKDKAAHREAVQAFKDAKKAARDAAAKEAGTWADNAKKQAGSAKAQRERIKAWLRVLDGILAASPPEVRARVGGFVKMAGIATDEAALRYLEDRVAKLDRELEKYLVKQARGQLERIFDKARPKSDAGEKAKGKLTPELHAWFKLAEEAAKLSPAVADERIQGIEQSLASDMTDAIKQELSDWLGRPVTDDAEAQTWQETRLTLFQTFGAVMYGTDAKSERNAAEITAALDAAREAYQTGRLAHIEQLAKLREKRAEDRGDGIQRVGSPYDPNKANTRKKALNEATGLKGRALDYMDTGLDASGFFLDLLGDDTTTDLYETTRRNLLEAAATKADNMEKRKADFAAMLKQVFPGKGLVDRLRGLWELQQIQENAPVGTMSQLQAMQFTLWHLDPDSREWLATNGYGDEWQAKAEQWLTAEAKAVRAWLLKQYDGQYDRLNPVFRRLRGVNLPRVEVYGGKRQIEHSKSDSTASIEADMMRGGMDAGFTKTRVSRPTGRPRMTDALQNYWQNALQVEHYIAFAETVTELKAVFGHRDFLGAVETNRGLAKKQQVLDWISNIETAGTRDAFAHSMQGKLFGRYGKAVSASALLLKLVTLAKQAPAAIQSAFKVGLKEYFTSLSRIMAGKGAISLGDMYRSDTVQRRLSEHDSEMLQASKGWNQRHFENEILDKAAIAPEVMMNAGWYAMGWTDARFTTISAAVAYDVAFRDGKKLGMTDDEAKAFAANQADLIVMETAQPQDVVTKSLSENMMPQALLRLVFQFMSANRQVFGLTYLAAKQGKVANAYAVAALIAAMTQTIGGIMRMMFSDDDPEELFDPQAYALGMATAPLTGMVGLGPLVEFGLNFFGVESRFSPSSAAAAKSLEDIVNGEADTKDIGRVVSMAGAALGGRGAMLGVGWNVLNQIMGLYENVADQ